MATNASLAPVQAPLSRGLQEWKKLFDATDWLTAPDSKLDGCVRAMIQLLANASFRHDEGELHAALELMRNMHMRLTQVGANLLATRLGDAMTMARNLLDGTRRYLLPRQLDRTSLVARLLKAIEAASGWPKLNELVETVDEPTDDVRQSLKVLEGRGLVIRQFHGHQRPSTWYLTPAGAEVIDFWAAEAAGSDS
jgi:hypothetical protein